MTSVISIEQNGFWNEIKLIDSKFNKFQVLRTNDTTLTIDFSKFDYSLAKSINESIRELANEKGVGLM